MNELTVAICVYNSEKYIEETLDCIVAQTFQNFDLLIINDCSTDTTRQKIIDFFENNPRPYRLVDFEENSGLAVGRRYVEKNATNKYILFIDADDLPQPSLVEKLYNKIASDDDLMAVGCYLDFIDSNGKSITGGQYLGDKTKKDFYVRAENRKLIFLASNAIFDREVANSVGGRAVDGFFESKPRFQDLCEDLDLWTRMSDLYVHNKAIIVLPEALLRYRKHEQGISSSSFNMVLRMKHIKTNLLRRRCDMPELTFIEFYNSLSKEQLDKLKYKSTAADELRKGAFLLKKGKIFSATGCLIKSVWTDPIYFWQKVKSNSGIFR